MRNFLQSFIKENFERKEEVIDLTRKRIEFIDLAKGVCILLVVIYHTEVINCGNIPGLKALRMPLYFVLSGLFFKLYGGFIELFIKKFNKILIPFLFFYFIGWCLNNILAIAPWTTEPYAMPFLALFTERIGPIWFLECLFITTILFGCICTVFHKEAFRFVAVIIFGIIGYVLSTHDIFLPCQIDVAFTAIPFFYFGYFLKKAPILYATKYDRYDALAGIILLIMGIFLFYAWDKPYIEFWNNTIKGGLFANYILAALFVIGVLLICKRIKWLPIISYIGRFSIMILIMHELILNVMKSFAPYLRGYGINYIYFIVVFMGSWLSIPLLRKYLPQFTAQKDMLNISYADKIQDFFGKRLKLS